MIETIINGIIQNWLLVTLSFLMLVLGTYAAYKKYGLKRVLLGKSFDDRELIYTKFDDSIDWKPTLKSWKIILTGGMSTLTIFLLIMILALSFFYARDLRSQIENDEMFCKEFGTVKPTQEQLEEYYRKERGYAYFDEINFSNITISQEK